MAATVAVVGVGLGPKPAPALSPFFGKKLPAAARPRPRPPVSGAAAAAVCAGWEWARELFVGVGVGLPCTVMECGDIIYRSTLPRSTGPTFTTPGVALALGALSYLWATPGVAPGFFDMFVLAFVERLFRPTFRKVAALPRFFFLLKLWIEKLVLFFSFLRVWQDDLVLGKKLGEGAFGVVYKASLAEKRNSKIVS